MQSIKINEISITNYKGINSLNFSPKDINIIVGPNNTGKSSLLNAISLVFYSLNEFKNDNTGLFDKRSLYPLDHQIYESNENISKIYLNFIDNSKGMNLPFELEIVYGKDFPNRYFNLKAFKKYTEQQSQLVINKEMREIRKVIRDHKYPQEYFSRKKAEIEGQVFTELYESCSDTLYFKLKHKNDIILESYIENLRRKVVYSSFYPRESPFRTFFRDLEKLGILKETYDFNYIFRSQLKKFDIKEKKPLTYQEVLDLRGAFNAIEQFNLKSKIFCIGLSRTGTKSLTAALYILGYNIIHYPHDEITFNELSNGNYNFNLLDDYDGISDITISPYYTQLDKLFSNSKFILTVREKEAWLKSFEKHWSDRPPFDDPTQTETYMKVRRFLRASVYGTYKFNRERMSYVYNLHFKNVLNYFKGLFNLFLIFDDNCL